MRIMSPLLTVAMVMVVSWAVAAVAQTQIARAVDARSAVIGDIRILPNLDAMHAQATARNYRTSTNFFTRVNYCASCRRAQDQSRRDEGLAPALKAAAGLDQGKQRLHALGGHRFVLVSGRCERRACEPRERMIVVRRHPERATVTASNQQAARKPMASRSLLQSTVSVCSRREARSSCAPCRPISSKPHPSPSTLTTSGSSPASSMIRRYALRRLFALGFAGLRISKKHGGDPVRQR